MDNTPQSQRISSDGDIRLLVALFEQAPGWVAFLRGRECVFELANAAYYQLVGHRDIVGKTLLDALPEVTGQGYLELLQSVFDSGVPFVGRGMKADIQREPGAPLTEAFFDLVYQPIRGSDGRITGVLAMGQDVTDSKREESKREAAEAALRASEERYRTVLESNRQGYCVMQLLFDESGEPQDYRFLETNSAFEEQSGLTDALGKTARELVPGLDPSWFRLYGGVASTGEAAHFENHAPAMGRWFDVHATRVGEPANRHVALVFKDITERKHAEAERERLHARERAARVEAEEASRLKDEFLATVSHELRTPLNAMLGWVQMLRTGALSPEKRERALETIERNARAQSRLIEDLLDTSRMLVGKLRLEVAHVDLEAIVEAALETVRPAADAKGIRVQSALCSGGIVMGDAHRLQQIVWNLLANAVKFTPKGGRVQVLVERRDSVVEITVADTGMGIPSELQAHVFDRFRQIDGGPSRSAGGLGLGLSIVRQLVEMHGGTVAVFSEGTDKGSSFTVRLPIAIAQRRESGSLLSSDQTELSCELPCPPEVTGLHVVVVDDERDSREMLQALLEGGGAHVRIAASASEGLRLIEAEPPDVLISDIGMPEADGYDFIAKVRNLAPASGAGVPAVALTAYARTEDRTRALRAGFDTHVPKPVDPLELFAVIVSLSARARRRPA